MPPAGYVRIHDGERIETPLRLLQDPFQRPGNSTRGKRTLLAIAVGRFDDQPWIAEAGIWNAGTGRPPRAPALHRPIRTDSAGVQVARSDSGKRPRGSDGRPQSPVEPFAAAVQAVHAAVAAQGAQGSRVRPDRRDRARQRRRDEAALAPIVAPTNHLAIRPQTTRVPLRDRDRRERSGRRRHSAAAAVAATLIRIQAPGRRRPTPRRRSAVVAPAHHLAVGTQTAGEPPGSADRRELPGRWARPPISVRPPTHHLSAKTQTARKVSSRADRGERTAR